MSSTVLESIFAREEIDHLVPIAHSGQFQVAPMKHPIQFQYSTNDFNFGELGLVNVVKMKNRQAWSFASGKKKDVKAFLVANGVLYFFFLQGTLC